MNGVIYARYSKGPNQTDLSIEGQVNDCTRYAQQNGINILEVYADRHITGKSTEGRDELQRMLTDAKKHKFDNLICWKVDRLGRDKYDLAIIKRQLKQCGVKIHYAMEHIPDGPEGIILESLMEGLAEYYSAELRQKVIRGLRTHAENGVFPLQPPIGYTRDEGRHLVIDEATAPYVRLIFERTAQGVAQKEVLEELNDIGARAFHDKPFSRSTIYRILRNERYTGKFEVQGVVIEAPAIIDEYLFRKVQDILEKRQGNKGKHSLQHDYLLSRKCYCSECGAMLRGESANGRNQKYYYYKCPTKSCSLKTIHADKLENAVINAVHSTLFNDEIIAELTDKIMKLQQDDDTEIKTKSLKSALDSAQKKKANLIEIIAETGNRELVSRLDELTAEIESLKRNLDEITFKHPEIPRQIVESYIYQFKNGELDDPKYRKKLLHAFVDTVIVSKDCAEVYFLASSTESDTVRFSDEKVDYTEAKTNQYKIAKSYICIIVSLKNPSVNGREKTQKEYLS